MSDDPLLKETARPKSADPKGLYLYGMQRARTWRGRRVSETDVQGVQRVRYRDLEALVRSVIYDTPEIGDDSIAEHQRVVEGAMRHGTVVPAPFGIVFHGRRPLLKMLQEQYLMIDEALSFLEGQCEVRIHITAPEARDEDDASDIAMEIYSDLRRLARAAVPFPRDGRRVASAAFLVEKSSWVDFIQRAEELGSHHLDLSLDITGPWPPYDFVRFAP